MSLNRPAMKPHMTCFSSGPCVKRPGWSFDGLKNALLGRSHRAAIAIKRIQDVCDKSRAILGIPDDYKIAVVPGSDTGAFEMALWNMMGARGVEALGWDVFGRLWVNDILKHLKIQDARAVEADFGLLPDLSDLDMDKDIVFTWNGTTAGVCVPDGEWISAERKGLTFCDATSAVFAMSLPWDKLDVVTWSWQKALGGEAAHGMLVLSPRAVERLESYTPPWPIPKLFRLTKDGKLNEGIFQGKTINTPSMMCVEDCLDTLKWCEDQGGLPSLTKRSLENLKAVERWVSATDWAEFLAEAQNTRSSTSICFKPVDPWFRDLSAEMQVKIIKEVEKLVEKEDAGYEVANHRESPPSFRIWGGATVETMNIVAVLDWIDWAYRTVREQQQSRAA